MDSGKTLRIRIKNDTSTRAEWMWHQWSKRLCAASRLACNRAEFAASSANYQLGHRLESMIVQRDSPILQSMILQQWTLLIVLLGYREVSGHGVMPSWRDARDGLLDEVLCHLWSCMVYKYYSHMSPRIALAISCQSPLVGCCRFGIGRMLAAHAIVCRCGVP